MESRVMSLSLRVVCLCHVAILLMGCDRTEAPARSESDGAGPMVTKAHREPGRKLQTTSRDAGRQSLAKAMTSTKLLERDKAIAQVAWESISSDPDLALEALQRISSESPEKLLLIQHMAMRMADENIDQALAWAATMESEREAAAARVRIAQVVADRDPARAAHLLSEFGLANREFDVAVVQVLQHWADRSAKDAAAWVVTFPADAFRKEGIHAVISQWTQSDRQAAFEWVSAQTDETLRAEAGDALVRRFLALPAETRSEWLQSADAILREKFMHAERLPKE
jgi:hypothetical protein